MNNQDFQVDRAPGHAPKRPALLRSPADVIADKGQYRLKLARAYFL